MNVTGQDNRNLIKVLKKSRKLVGATDGSVRILKKHIKTFSFRS